MVAGALGYFALSCHVRLCDISRLVALLPRRRPLLAVSIVNRSLGLLPIVLRTSFGASIGFLAIGRRVVIGSPHHAAAAASCPSACCAAIQIWASSSVRKPRTDVKRPGTVTSTPNPFGPSGTIVYSATRRPLHQRARAAKGKGQTLCA